MIFWFCLPALLSLMLMFVYPVCRTVLMSFFQVESVTASMSDWSFYGLGNYTKIFGSASFLTSMRNMLLIWLVGGVFTLTLAMLMAVIVTSGIEGIPKDLYEAATIDGAGKVHQFTHIMLPLVQPAIITVTIFNFMSVWNEFFMALIFTTSESMSTVGVGLLNIINAMKQTGQMGGMFAAVIIVFLPTFLLYIFLSEKIISGVTGGGVKG